MIRSVADDGHVTHDMRHAAITHQRWLDRRHRVQESPAYQEAWYGAQCGSCRYWVPLSGALGSDYGGCTNDRSEFDMRLMFEHDGCDDFAPAAGWAQPQPD